MKNSTNYNDIMYHHIIIVVVIVIFDINIRYCYSTLNTI